MKRFFQLISCAALMALATTSFGQDANAKMSRASDLTSMLTRALNLSPEQSSSIKSMAVNYYAEIDVIAANTETFEEKKKELDKNYDLKLKEILTKEQIEKFEEMKKDELKRREAEKK